MWEESALSTSDESASRSSSSSPTDAAPSQLSSSSSTGASPFPGATMLRLSSRLPLFPPTEEQHDDEDDGGMTWLWA